MTDAAFETQRLLAVLEARTAWRADGAAEAHWTESRVALEVFMQRMGSPLVAPVTPLVPENVQEVRALLVDLRRVGCSGDQDTFKCQHSRNKACRDWGGLCPNHRAIQLLEELVSG